ncbi:SusC/RagA family TonB-linked outer membrane protein [Leadbetterella sp. DM7]|uniref:SusC/RagA family TonB-linked outer membrane protein n=1 Tax=Leadbetterella sp. DM7 TaxID=3235085 RepID=UPI00349F006B
MKKRLLLLFGMILFGLGTIYAQTRTISGTVRSSEDNSPLPGVSVIVKGTTNGTYTNEDGNYRLTVPSNSTLIYSFIGFKDKEVAVGNQSVLNVTLEVSNTDLTEVVVTGAYGTQQSARSTTFSAQVINSDQLNTIRQNDFNSALAGKVAGIQVRSQSAAALGRQTEVRLRGISGLSGGGPGALYVVDGTILPNVDDINNDDIESISILQGPAAAAQFGSQAAAGAIVITMKKAKRQEGFGVTLNLGVQFDNVYIMPNYQNSYAGGSGPMTRYNWKEGDPVEWKALDGKYYHDYQDDASWGPRMVGQEYIPWYAWYGGHSRSYQTASLVPQEDNSRDFFETGVIVNNSITVNHATEKMLFKLTYGNNYTNGLIPGSSLAKNTINLNSTYDISKKLELSANINYTNRRLNGQINDDYSNQSSGSFNQWYHRDLDMGIMKELRDLRTPEGIYASWNKSNPTAYDASNPRGFYAANYWYNFYTYYDLIDLTNVRDRLFGDVSLTYKVTKDLNLRATYRKQQNTTWYEDKYRSELNESGTQTQGNDSRNYGYYSTGTTYSNRRNIELIATYKKKIADFDIDAMVGTDFFKWVSKENKGNTNQGLNVPNLFALSNSVNQATQENSRTSEAYNAAFGKLAIGYRNFLYLNGTLRNDWYSTLPPDNNDVLSKSFGASFVFSEFTKSALPWLSLGKVRASWGEVPQALGSGTTFGAYRYPGMAYSVNQFKWGSNFLMNTPDQVVDPNIHGAVSQQKEAGIDLEFLRGKYGINFTYWDGTEVGFPYALTINSASGFSSLLTNIGKITKKGIEISLKAQILNLPYLKWNANFNYADLIENDVVELSPEYGVTQTANVGAAWGTGFPYQVHSEGKRWGQLYGNGMKRINGQPVLNDDGSFVREGNQYFGSVLPRYTGGLQNSLTVLKNFHVNVNFDYQFGGKFYSLSQQWGSYSGLTARTATVNDKGNPIRDAVADGGGVHVFGVNAEGKPVDYYVEARDYFQGTIDNNIGDDYIYDLTFIKLRELSIGYSVPVAKLGLARYFNNATISVVSRNPLLIYAKSKDFDPSEISATYGERGQLPGTRSLGVNLRIGF